MIIVNVIQLQAVCGLLFPELLAFAFRDLIVSGKFLIKVMTLMNLYCTCTYCLACVLNLNITMPF